MLTNALDSIGSSSLNLAVASSAWYLSRCDCWVGDRSSGLLVSAAMACSHASIARSGRLRAWRRKDGLQCA